MRYILGLLLVFLNFIIYSQIPSYIPSDNLLGWWPLDNNSNDYSGNGRHGNLQSVTYNSNLGAFEFNNNSDVDFVVDFKDVERNVYADNYFNFKKSLENLFNRKINLLEKIALKNPYFIQVLNDTKKVVY